MDFSPAGNIYTTATLGLERFWKVNKWLETENGYGTTEQGSSGSPLLNENHRIVGQVKGGPFYICDDANKKWTEFGKFDVVFPSM